MEQNGSNKERNKQSMTTQQLIDTAIFNIVCLGDSMDTVITKPFCCDLLSIAMGKAPAGAAWVTVMANLNTLAVAALTDSACIIFAEGVRPDISTVEKAKQQGITMLSTELPVFEAAWKVQQLL